MMLLLEPGLAHWGTGGAVAGSAYILTKWATAGPWYAGHTATSLVIILYYWKMLRAGYFSYELCIWDE